MNPHSTYRLGIDGMRAVARHYLSAWLVPGGHVGVNVFFVISDHR